MATIPTITDGGTTVTFAAMTGVPAPLAERVEEITRAGVDGTAFRRLGKASRPIQVRTVADVADAAGAKAAWQSYRALVGQVVTFTDSLLNDWPHSVVVDVELIRMKRILAAAGGLLGGTPGQYVVVALWTIQLGELPNVPAPEPEEPEE